MFQIKYKDFFTSKMAVILHFYIKAATFFQKTSHKLFNISWSTWDYRNILFNDLYSIIRIFFGANCKSIEVWIKNIRDFFKFYFSFKNIHMMRLIWTALIFSKIVYFWLLSDSNFWGKKLKPKYSLWEVWLFLYQGMDVDAAPLNTPNYRKVK